VLAQIAQSIGCDPSVFAQRYEAAITNAVQPHIIQTRQHMQSAGLGGFPALVLQAGDHTQVLHHDRFYGQAPAFVAHVAQQLASA
jgi:protein-disulfide isomerase-like protein with CxxC motif